jgi:hypothetical protein
MVPGYGCPFVFTVVKAQLASLLMETMCYLHGEYPGLHLKVFFFAERKKIKTCISRGSP